MTLRECMQALVPEADRERADRYLAVCEACPSLANCNPVPVWFSLSHFPCGRMCAALREPQSTITLDTGDGDLVS